MSSKARKPSWWQVYAMVLLLAALLLLEMRLSLTTTEHTFAQLGIVLLIYVFIHIWLRANQRALMGIDQEHREWQMRVYGIPPAEQSAADEVGRRIGQRPLFHLPKAGLKGMLGNTFEVDDFDQEPRGATESYSSHFAHEEHEGSGKAIGASEGFSSELQTEKSHEEQ